MADECSVYKSIAQHIFLVRLKKMFAYLPITPGAEYAWFQVKGRRI